MPHEFRQFYHLPKGTPSPKRQNTFFSIRQQLKSYASFVYICK